MSSLFLIRHGQASYGIANYDQLSALGVRQAHAIGEALAQSALHAAPFDAIYAGPLKRQRDTALHLREAADAGGRALPPIQILDELTEYPAFELLRHWVPRLVAEDPQFAPLAGEGVEKPEMVRLLDLAFEKIIGQWGRGEIVTEGVESFADFVARVRRGIETIVRAHGKGARVVAVTSGGVIGTAVHLALEFALPRTLDVMRMVRNGSISELAYRSRDFAWRAGEFSLVGFNHVEHLRAAEMITFR